MSTQTQTQTSNKTQTPSNAPTAPKSATEIQASTLAGAGTLAPSDDCGPAVDADSALESAMESERKATLADHALLAKACRAYARNSAVRETVKRIAGKLAAKSAPAAVKA